MSETRLAERYDEAYPDTRRALTAVKMLRGACCT